MMNTVTREQSIETILKAQKDAKTAAGDLRNIMTFGKVEAAKVFGFTLMHMGSEESPYSLESQKAEYRLAEAMRNTDAFWRNRLMSDFVAEYLNARGIEWAGIEILGDAQLIEHGAEGHYHYAFRALVTL